MSCGQRCWGFANLRRRGVQAREILRVWTIEDKEQHFAIDGGVWSDPAAWGLLLVDISRQVARAISQSTDQSEETVLARIKAGFDAEWESRTA
jgi:hypothetical protein